MKRIGIFGGTFSPVHNGHVAAARRFYERMSLDILYIVPARLPPHKRLSDGAGDDDRMNMAKAAFGGIDGIVVSDFEMKRATPSYSYYTLCHFAPEGELYMLCGTDMFLSLENWFRASDVIGMCVPVCMPRSAADVPAIEKKAAVYREKYGVTPRIIRDGPVEVSSTEIRRAVREGRDISGLVPQSVKDYIIGNGLYK